MRTSLSGPPKAPRLQLTAESAAEEYQLASVSAALTNHKVAVRCWPSQYSPIGAIEFGLQPGVDPNPEPMACASVVRELEEDLSVAIKQFQRLQDLFEDGVKTREKGLEALKYMRERYPKLFIRL